MTAKNRALTGTSSTNTPTVTAGELGFPAHLLHPPQSQLTRSEDAVANRIVQLDVWAQRLGEGFGIACTNFTLNPVPTFDNTSAAASVAAVLVALSHRAERISLERRGGRWGLYFSREPAALSQDRKAAEPVPLKDAPLDVRERFLMASEGFFRDYLRICEERLGTMGNAVSQADHTLSLLSRLKLL